MKNSLWVLAFMLSVFSILLISQAKTVSPTTIHSDRYQIFISQREEFLLDTDTGKIWHRTIYTGLVNGSADLWQPMDRVDNPEEKSAWLSAHPAWADANKSNH